MSPEQARRPGRRTGATDVWAFGTMLFEMLTGQRVFQGDSVADTLAAVIHGDPRLDRLPLLDAVVRPRDDRPLPAKGRARSCARHRRTSAWRSMAPSRGPPRQRLPARYRASVALARGRRAGGRAAGRAAVWVFQGTVSGQSHPRCVSA
jgi:serine/threonine protein kinase